MKLLHGPADRYRWAELCRSAQRAREQDPSRFDAELLPEVQRVLAGWDDALKEAPYAWTLRYFDPSDEDPLLALPRVLRYRCRDDYLLRKRERLELSPHAHHLHTLDLHVDYPHNRHVRPVLEALLGQARIATLQVRGPASAGLDKHLHLLEGLTALRLAGYLSGGLQPFLPARSSTLRELTCDGYCDLPERDWFSGLSHLFVKVQPDQAEAVCERLQQIRGLQGLTVQLGLDRLLRGDPDWDLRELRFARPMTPQDVEHLAALPGLSRVERLEGEADLEAQRQLVLARLPSLQRAWLDRNVYLWSDGGALENYRTRAPHYERLLGWPLHRCALEAREGGGLQYTQFAIGPYDLLNEDLEMSLELLDLLLSGLEGQPLRRLQVISPSPEATERLLSWPPLAQLRDLVLVLDTLTDGDWPEALSIPYRADGRDFAMLAASEPLKELERLHLALSFTRDDRWRKKELASLQSLPRLHSLDLSQSEILDADLARLLQSSLLRGVVRLSLAGNRCTNVDSLFRQDDGTFGSLEYLDCTDISGYDTTGSNKMSSSLEDTRTFLRLETLLLEGSAQTEFGETIDQQCMGREHLPSLVEVTTSHYYFEVME